MMISQPKDDFIYGSRAIIEAINAGKEIDKLLLQKDIKNELTTELLVAARDFNIPVQKVPVEKLNRITRKNHQGAIAFVSSVVYASLDNIISEAYSKGEVPLLIVLDRITDVRNFGAIARTAECVGAHGIVIPSRGSAQVGSDAMKTSAGALNFIPVCRADNLKTTLREIRDNGITVLACTEKATDLVYQQDLTVPIALLMGSEEDGISPEYLKLADELCKLPIKGNIESLNVSVATSVVLYEVVRQRG
ncbi:23S rRNA (guanosine(2251)-2'-O)-methyltransferase RlmB [uncultured Roseivirga sp.]|uniref:23S rRNA (guanosine(2251)-2'-O)-methyltransferase RlmB n=1 Tax=uncultured Roseivirga sp. TaxID=543088 RepID=UPI0030D7326E|tara:strand:+ start:176356 stop:177102 length:747 start_codon:yes stop_codon:yes gene_type:complete